jgi:hypothetical protein
MNLAARIALNEVDEAIKRVANIFGIDRNLGGGVLHLDSAERLPGRDCVILGDLEVEFLAWAKVQPCETTCVQR